MKSVGIGRARESVAALLLFAILHAVGFGQDSFVAIRPQEAAQYHLNFARNFFPSPQAEKADRADLYARLKALETFKGKLAASADNLQRALMIYDAVQIQLMRHYAYLYLRNAVDTRDETSLAESAALSAEVMSRTIFVQRELMQIDDRLLAGLVARKPALKKYLFAIEDIRRFRPYTLSLKEEELLSATAPMQNGWQYDLYEKLIASTEFASVKTKDGALDVWKQRGALANSSDQKVREAGFKLRYAGLASQRDLYAFTLSRLAGAGNQLARLRHYEDAPSAAYFSRYISKAEVNDLLKQLAGRAELYKRYQRLRAEHAGKIMGLRDVNVWDISVRPPAMQLPRFSIDEASRIIRAALKPLGNEFGEEMAKLLDPANGRMDIVPGENRKAGGFSQGFIGTDSVFYAGGFAGSYNDVRVLAHEATHAVHRQLMNRNQVLPAYASGPHYLFEAFAIFSEFLLADYLYQQETDSLRQQFYLEQFLDGKGTVMFVVAPEAALEQTVYERGAEGKFLGANELDALTREIYSRFSIWPEKHDELKNQWMNIPLMYEDPFYDVNYIYGGLLALKFYELFQRNPARFTERYIALMRNGFDAPPAHLLKRFLDIDLNDPRLVSDAISITESKVNLLAESYRK
ncbi:MAG TPA: M3 family metallopeptidase [Pyrinomonadaceae bacterium]